MKLLQIINSVFTTIRTGNLVMICLSLLMVRYTIIIPLLNFVQSSPVITQDAFSMLLLSVLFIAAGGYIINDFFDIEIDKLNKPGKNKVGFVLPRKSAIAIYALVTLTGIVLSWVFGNMIGIKYPMLLIILCAGLLYFYSATYKKMLLLGNVVVAFLAGLTIFLPVLFDYTSRHATPIVILVGGYAIFAFALTLIREIIKDCEDVDGDSAYGTTTLPAVFGLKTARLISSFLTLITLAAIIWIQVKQEQYDSKISFWYTTILVDLPLSYLCIKLLYSKNTKHFHHASQVAKLIMTAGIISMLVFYIVSL